MAKPDLQAVYVSPTDGQLKRLKGKLGLAPAFDNIIVADDENAAILLGLQVGGVWADGNDANSLKVRTV